MRHGLLSGVMGLATWIALHGIVTVDAATPNFEIIHADDLGEGDVRVNNPGRVRLATPHLERVTATRAAFEGLSVTVAVPRDRLNART